MRIFDLKTYWDERCERYGHTGYANELIYAYDQPLRIRAIKKALLWSKIVVDKNVKVLDIGCGTGDLLLEFTKMGAEVTGIDISDKAIAIAKKRFIKEKISADFFASKVEEMMFSPNTFDLVTSITVLQHIVDEKAFSIAVKKIVNVVKPGGHVLLLETSPPYKYKRKFLEANIPPYIVIRSREEYVNAFENAGCVLVQEIGIPQIGIKFLQICSIMIGIMWPHERYFYRVEGSSAQLGRVTFKNLQKIILKCLWPFDYFLLPFPKKRTNLRILIFRKADFT